MSARGEAHETGCGSSHNAAARQLCESSPAGRAAVLVKSSESDGVAYDALHQQRVMRAPEDPGGKGARPYISMAGCHNLVENSGFRTSNGISHPDDEGRRPLAKDPLQVVCVGAALHQQGALAADYSEVVPWSDGQLDLGPGISSQPACGGGDAVHQHGAADAKGMCPLLDGCVEGVLHQQTTRSTADHGKAPRLDGQHDLESENPSWLVCGGGSVVHQHGAADTKGLCSLPVNCVQGALHQQSARSANDQETASWIDGHPDLGPGTQSRLACGGGSVVHQHGAADTKGPCSLSVNCVQGALH